MVAMTGCECRCHRLTSTCGACCNVHVVTCPACSADTAFEFMRVVSVYSDLQRLYAATGMQGIGQTTVCKDCFELARF